jgi:transposase
MNVRVHRAVADVNGTTGMAIVRAIVAGERNPRELAKLRDPHCHKSEEAIAEQLSGHWREDHLFNLRQAVKMYDSIEEQLAEYEREIIRRMEQLRCEQAQGRSAPPPRTKEKAKSIKRRGQEPARQGLFAMSGGDLTAIDGVGVETVEVVLSEYGPRLEQFPTEDQFIAHVGLAPHRPVTGGKPMKNRRKPRTGRSRVNQALSMAASTLQHSQTALGAYYRRIAQHHDRGVAVFATARKLGQHIYRALKWGQPYVDIGAAAQQQRYDAARLRTLTQKAAQAGYQLLPLDLIPSVTAAVSC